ncbi:MAG TPA: DUF1330 domain-containing protein, partial [Spirochaetes bacterium]|nr:DUF1330 domain-containing protein [Spirochaetota bacterium]
MLKTMLLVIFTLGLFSGCDKKNPSSQKAETSQLYTIVSQEVHDSEKYSQYRANIKKEFQKHGGKLIREFTTLGKPIGVIPYGAANKVLLIGWDSPNGFKDFLNDPEYKKYKHLVLESVRNLKIMSGKAIHLNIAKPGEIYVLKISNYKATDGKAQKIANEINNRLEGLYGLYKEIVIKPNTTKGIERADDVALFYYKKAVSQKELYKNKKIMKEIGDFNKTYL